MAHLSDGVLPLAALRTKPFTQPPPAALARGLQQLLRKAAAEGGSEGGSSRTGSSGGSTSKGGASNRAGSSGAEGGSGAALSDGLVLRRLAEHADRFELELAVEDRLGGSLSSSGLSCEFPGAPLGGGASHSLRVSGGEAGASVCRGMLINVECGLRQCSAG